jgi:hypothetical protein
LSLAVFANARRGKSPDMVASRRSVRAMKKRVEIDDEKYFT